MTLAPKHIQAPAPLLCAQVPCIGPAVNTPTHCDLFCSCTSSQQAARAAMQGLDKKRKFSQTVYARNKLKQKVQYSTFHRN